MVPYNLYLPHLLVIVYEAFVMRRVASNPTVLKTRPLKGRTKFLVRPSMWQTVYSLCGDNVSPLGGALLRLKSTAGEEDSSDGINSYMTVTEASFQVDGHQVLFDLEIDGLRHIYLHKTRYTSDKTSSSFNTDMWKALVRCSSAQRSFDHT